MTQVVLYTKKHCAACTEAKKILERAKISFFEQVLDQDFSKEYIKEQYPLATTYPIVVYQGYYIGGTTELKEQIVENIDNRKLLNE